MKKPIKPIMPDSRHPKYANDQSSRKGWDNPFVCDYKKYQKDLIKYKADLEEYDQTKLINLVKNSSLKYCLKALKITKV